MDGFHFPLLGTIDSRETIGEACVLTRVCMHVYMYVYTHTSKRASGTVHRVPWRFLAKWGTKWGRSYTSVKMRRRPHSYSVMEMLRSGALRATLFFLNLLILFLLFSCPFKCFTTVSCFASDFTGKSKDSKFYLVSCVFQQHSYFKHWRGKVV